MIFTQLYEQLNRLNNLLCKLDSSSYTKQIKHLGNASIGGHTRHIIELLKCLTNGYELHKVDYINRERNLQIQEIKEVALDEIEMIIKDIKKTDKELLMITEDELSLVTTTYYREVIYNIEHVIHHLALIKVALMEMELNIVDENFGMAYSTLKYKASLTSANT